MTTREFSENFDILFNSHATAQGSNTSSPTNIDEYEKSVLLTIAQKQVVQGLYNGTLTGYSFEEIESLRRELGAIVKTIHPTITSVNYGLDTNSIFYVLDDDLWFITYESADINLSVLDNPKCPAIITVKVIPVRQDEWATIKENPFKRPNNRKVVRLDVDKNIVELISSKPIVDYLVRYIRKPKPIILTQLEGNLTIDGEQNITDCELSSVIHQVILERAVQLAQATKLQKIN